MRNPKHLVRNVVNERKGAGLQQVCVVDFADRFTQHNGSISCRELLGCDISTAEGMRQAQHQNLFKTTCVQMVKDAAEILEDMERQP